MKGKIKPNGIVTHATGPTNTINDPAKFHGPGKSHGKIAANGVECGPSGGVTFIKNSAAIGSFPNADKAPKSSKVEKEGGMEVFAITDTAKDKTASQEGAGGAHDRPYPLKDRYQKRSAK